MTIYHFCQWDFCQARIPDTDPYCPAHQEQDAQMLQPFEDKDVLFRFTPTEEEKGPPGEHWDVADEYVVHGQAKAECRIVLYAKYHEQWHVNPWNERPVIRHLLAERENYEGLEEQIATFQAAFVATCEIVDALVFDLGVKEYWQGIVGDLASYFIDKERCNDVAHGQVVGKLHQQVKNLEAEREEWRASSLKAGGLVREQIMKIQKAKAERDVYLDTLESIRTNLELTPVSGDYSREYIINLCGVVIHALEQGKKIREQS